MFLLIVPGRYFFCGLFLLFVLRVCHVFLSVSCSLVVTCWKRDDLLALMCVMFYCVFVALTCGVLVQVWFLIVSISGLCLLSYFFSGHSKIRPKIECQDRLSLNVSQKY